MRIFDLFTLLRYTEKMTRNQFSWFYSLAILLALSSEISYSHAQSKAAIKSAVYLSPAITLKPGSVENRLFYNVEFPKGHIGIKSFYAELVNEAGESIPLVETYMHHWAVFRYYVKPENHSDLILVRNSGVCPDNLLGQYFGMGSETRKTDTHVPDPYAIEVGNPSEVPQGYAEGWLLNVHAIDLRGVVNRTGCTECRCSFYNVTKDETGKPLKPGYEGGFHCCYNQTHCMVKEGVALLPRRVYLRYTVKWVDWDQSVLPVRFYILDVTDTPTTSISSVAPTKHHCKIEYEVKPCKYSDAKACVDTKRTKIVIPKGGYVVYGVGLQYPGGIGASLYKKDGQVICSSKPIYGKGTEVGNEAGFIVGMSTCYPQPGSVHISDGETLVLESNYNSSAEHPGAAGFIKIMVADQAPKEKSFFESLRSSLNW